MKVLYINDYACSKNSVEQCIAGCYPKSHLWGMVEFIQLHPDTKVKLLNINNFTPPHFERIFKSKFVKFIHLYKVICVFVLHFKYDIVYSALPGYELGFLIAKKLGVKKYRIISVVHHPASRLMMVDMYDKLIFISKVAYEKYSSRENVEYLFWGPDLDFYNSNIVNESEIKYDFVAAGKTHRDYMLLRKALAGRIDRIAIFGENDSKNNEICYSDLLKEYRQARFIAIPMRKMPQDNAILIGLTSFVDALGMGLPILISDNSLIGIDIEKLNIGYVYRAGDLKDLEDTLKKYDRLTPEKYQQMCVNCKKFAEKNSFAKFSSRICELIKP